MSESLFDIFGDHHTRQVGKNVTRQPLSNIENMGKSISAGLKNSTGPIKPNEPMKKAGEPKKSFLSNTGKALQSTPARQVFTPRAVNVASLIYSDDNDKGYKMEEVEFTKPAFKYDNYKELLDYLLPEPESRHNPSPPTTPPPVTKQHSMELDSSYQDEFFTDEFSLDSLPDDDLGLPALY